MSTATLRPAPRHADSSPGSGSALGGTGALLRLDLRRERLRLLVWTLAVGWGIWGSIVSLEVTYPTTESLVSRAALLDNPATIMMTGPVFAQDDYTFGAMVANELALYVLLAVAIMSVLVAVRHTRAEEESGRLELLRSLPVGRFAPATAAVATALVANVLVGAATTLGLLAGGMPAADSLAFGLATGLTGMVFAALTTVLAQVTGYARAATGMGMALVALAYLVRGVGDVLDHQGSWLSWLSPFAWAQQTRLYVDLRWWPLAVSAGVALAAYGMAMVLAQRRDLGAGLGTAHGGRAAASRALLSPAGLAARLLRGSLVAWGLGVVFFGVVMGALANELEDMLETNPALAEWMALEGTDPTAEFAGIILAYVMLAPLVVAVSGVLRLGTEEDDGLVERVLTSGAPRPGYLGGWLLAVLGHTLGLTTISGLGVGLGVVLGTGEVRWVPDMLVAALVYLPAIVLVGALAVALYGVAPRLTGIAWALVTWVALVLFLGELLDMPDWLRDLSPFTHTPILPSDDVAAVPLLVMGALAVVLTVVGVVGFRRRDIRG